MWAPPWALSSTQMTTSTSGKSAATTMMMMLYKFMSEIEMKFFQPQKTSILSNMHISLDTCKNFMSWTYDKNNINPCWEAAADKSIWCKLFFCLFFLDYIFLPAAGAANTAAPHAGAPKRGGQLSASTFLWTTRLPFCLSVRMLNVDSGIRIVHIFGQIVEGQAHISLVGLPAIRVLLVRLARKWERANEI